MSIVSFDDWKKKKQRGSAYNSRGGLRDDVAIKEEHGFDLCVYLSEEKAAPDSDAARIASLWDELVALSDSLPHEHAYHYFMAFRAYWQGEDAEFFKQFDLYLESEKRLYGECAECDWWIDSFVWVFTPPLTGMYGRIAELFFKHWPLCSMGWVFEALEQSEASDENMEQELDLLMLALAADKNNYLAYYLIATIYYDLRLFKSALPYFEKAAASTMYSQDPAFYFDYAWAADKAGKHEQSLELYTSCILLDETYPCAINNMGCTLLRMNRDEEALSHFTRALKLGLDGVLPYKNTVAVLEKLSRYDDAVRFIKRHVADGHLNRRYELEIPRLVALAKGEKTDPACMISAQAEAAKDDGRPPFDKYYVVDELERRAEATGELFGKEVAIVEDENGYGREYYLPGAGRMDLLLKSKNGYIVVAVTPKDDAERTVLKLARAMSVVKSTLAKRFMKVSGVLVAEDISPATLSLAAAFNKLPISIYRAGFTFTEVRPENQ